MPKLKLKTKRAANKRYRVTGSGKFKVGHKGKRHIFSNKSRNRKRDLRGTTLLTGGDEKIARRLMPYA